MDERHSELLIRNQMRVLRGQVRSWWLFWVIITLLQFERYGISGSRWSSRNHHFCWQNDHHCSAYENTEVTLKVATGRNVLACYVLAQTDVHDQKCQVYRKELQNRLVYNNYVFACIYFMYLYITCLSTYSTFVLNLLLLNFLLSKWLFLLDQKNVKYFENVIIHFILRI